VRDDARDVRIDDEDPARLDAFEPGLDRCALASARILDRFGAGVESGGAGLLVRCHDARAPDREGRGQYVAEHRLRKQVPHAPRFVQPRLPLRARKRDHDRRH